MILFSWLTLVLLAPQNSLENRVWGLTSEAYFFTVAESPLGMENGDAKGQLNFFPDAAQLGSFPINIEEIFSNM